MAANVKVQLRGCYRFQRITDQDRGRLIDAFENINADYLAVADTLGIKHATARCIVANYLNGRRKKLARSCKYMQHKLKVDDEMRQELLHLIEANPLTNADIDLAENLTNKPNISTSTIGRALDDILIPLNLQKMCLIREAHNLS